jgi:beta-phosphoglucomutase-like phosphatase (HAD superfamily)
VIEDSVSGVQAGLAAGMSVFAYAGGVTPAPRLGVGNATVFASMHDLPALLETPPIR